jgi:hypothetical protein
MKSSSTLSAEENESLEFTLTLCIRRGTSSSVMERKSLLRCTQTFSDAALDLGTAFLTPLLEQELFSQLRMLTKSMPRESSETRIASASPPDDSPASTPRAHFPPFEGI